MPGGIRSRQTSQRLWLEPGEPKGDRIELVPVLVHGVERQGPVPEDGGSFHGLGFAFERKQASHA